MNDVLNFLKENPVQYLATVGLDGAPKCRPFMFILEKDNKLWFCTNSEKQVYAEIQKNAALEFCVSTPEFAWMRLSGVAKFENNMAVKEDCMNIPMIKGIYQTADNPIFEVFYLDNAKATIADFSGNAPKEISL